MSDDVDWTLQAESLERVFHLPDWITVIQLEEELLKNLERRILASRPKGTMEEFAQEQLILRGGRDAVLQIWKLRSDLLNRLKANETQRKEMKDEH